MSREEAHGRNDPSGRRATGRTPEEAVQPQPPLFTARTDPTAGVIHARGHLDRVGAEVLCRVATALQQLGHREITVRLGASTTDADAYTRLAAHARRLQTGGVCLFLR